jgi:alpha-beta hydrolase superfamily lysophospholipase
LARGKSFVYENEWLSDAASVAPALSPDDPSNVVYVGLSSGVYLAVESALQHGARGLCGINPPIAMDAVQFIVRLKSSTNRMMRSLGNQLLSAMLYRPWVFAGLWHVGRVALPRKVSRDLMATAAKRGTDVLVLASPEDVSPAAKVPLLRSIDRRRIQSPKNYRAVFVPGLDHSMHAVRGREQAVSLLDDFILNRMGGEEPPRDQ